MIKYKAKNSLKSPRFAGVKTFMRMEHVVTTDDIDFAVVGIPYDTCASFRVGTRLGPAAIRDASALAAKPFNGPLNVGIFDWCSGVDYGDLGSVPGYIEESFELITEGMLPFFEKGIVPVAMGGDHSVTLPELRACAKVNGPVALIHFDAHYDTIHEYFGKPYNHGTPFYHAAKEGLVDTSKSIQVGIREGLYGPEDLTNSTDLGYHFAQSRKTPAEPLRLRRPHRYLDLHQRLVGIAGEGDVNFVELKNHSIQDPAMLRHICMQAGKGGVVPLQLASAVIHTQVIPRGYRALMLGLNGVTLHKDHGDGGNIIVAGLQQVPVRVDADTVAGQDGGHLVQVALQPGEGKGVLPGAAGRLSEGNHIPLGKGAAEDLVHRRGRGDLTQKVELAAQNFAEKLLFADLLLQQLQLMEEKLVGFPQIAARKIVGDVVDGHAKLPQLLDGAKFFVLADGIVAVAGLGIYIVRCDQSNTVIVPKRFAGHLPQLRKLCDGQQIFLDGTHLLRG